MNNDIEKEVIHEIDVCIPKYCYLKTLYGKTSRKFVLPMRIILFIIAIEWLILICLDKEYFKIGIPFAIIIIMITILSFITVRKNYKKIHAAKEDCIIYTFYSDSVKVKTPTIEAVYKYDTAEYFAEDKKRLSVIFPLNRSVTIDKSQCAEEKLDFIRNIVPEEKQKKTEKKTLIRHIIGLILHSLVVIYMAATIIAYFYLEKKRYNPEYPSTTYESFMGCLEHGTITDVVIINDKYVEYTYTGYEEDERFYTTCDDTDELIEKMNELDVDWEKE